MAIIVTYDVPSKHAELKKALLVLGYTDQILHSGKIIYLPNTTLYHNSKNAGEARDEVSQACAQLSIKLERCIATQWGSDWAAIYGEPFK